MNQIKTSDKPLMSLVEYSKSSYYLVKKDFEGYEKCLMRSIELCDQYLSNYVDLGQFYIKKGYLTKGYALMRKGLENLEYIYDEKHPYGDVLNLEEFFNERFKGIHLSRANYEIILESFDPKSPWITGDFINRKKDGATEN